MKVVCLKSEWAVSIKKNFMPYELPKKGEIYTIAFYEWDGDQTYYALRELPGGVYNSKGFRPTDETFGLIIADIIEKQVEFERTVEELSL